MGFSVTAAWPVRQWLGWMAEKLANRPNTSWWGMRCPGGEQVILIWLLSRHLTAKQSSQTLNKSKMGRQCSGLRQLHILQRDAKLFPAQGRPTQGKGG